MDEFELVFFLVRGDGEEFTRGMERHGGDFGGEIHDGFEETGVVAAASPTARSTGNHTTSGGGKSRGCAGASSHQGCRQIEVIDSHDA